MAEQKKEQQEIMNLCEASQYIRVSEKTLGEMARQNRIPCNKVGREWRFLKSALEDWLTGIQNTENSNNRVNVQFQNRKSGQLTLFEEAGFRDTAFTQNRKEPVHRWAPWIAGFSSSFVSGVFESLLEEKQKNITVLDPFAGVGTTLIEGIKFGYNVSGFEINPYAYLACRVKLNCSDYDPDELKRRTDLFAKYLKAKKQGNKLPVSSIPEGFQSRTAFFSPLVERQVLFTLDFITEQKQEWVKDIFKLALGAVMVSFSNYSYEPSLGRRTSSGKSEILDADVVDIISGKLMQFAQDIVYFKTAINSFKKTPQMHLFNQSYLEMNGEIKPRSIDILITSPPYLNNYHYLRNTRPQLYWLGLGLGKEDFKKLEASSFGKYWQTVRSGPTIELEFEFKELRRIIEQLREINPEKGPYGGYGWANYAATYFNDCAKFLKKTRKIMKRGAPVVVVIGNNILQGIEIKTEQFFAQIGQELGFDINAIHKVRTKRTGSSIVNSSVRKGSKTRSVELYECALDLRLP